MVIALASNAEQLRELVRRYTEASARLASARRRLSFLLAAMTGWGRMMAPILRMAERENVSVDVLRLVRPWFEPIPLSVSYLPRIRGLIEFSKDGLRVRIRPWGEWVSVQELGRLFKEYAEAYGEYVRARRELELACAGAEGNPCCKLLLQSLVMRPLPSRHRLWYFGFELERRGAEFLKAYLEAEEVRSRLRRAFIECARGGRVNVEEELRRAQEALRKLIGGE